MNALLKKWNNCVEYLESNEYTSADEAELTNDFACRSSIEKIVTSLSIEEKKELQRIDNRFRGIVITSLKKAKLLNIYRYWSNFAPESYWWWHVEE